MKKVYLSLITYLTTLPLFAVVDHPKNGKLFDDSVMHKIEILIDPDDFEYIMDNIDSDEEFPATVIFHNATDIDTVENIGFRLKGNVSRTNDKKPFKISFNSFEPGKKYKGVEKLNLHANWNDATQLRCHLATELFEFAGVATSRSSFAALYINDDYYGVYNIFEHIDEEFIKDRFGNDHGNLYKCLYPASLEWEGSDQDTYKDIWASNGRAYELKTNTEADDYSRFVEFLDVLNNGSGPDFECDLEAIFNVEDYLKVIAVDIAIGNWDGYIYNQNNFYLYDNPETGKFEFIPYDFDNSFGIDWVGRDWGERDIYEWSQGSNNRPLYDRLMDTPKYREIYSHYVQDLILQRFNLDSMSAEIYRLQAMLAPWLQIDDQDKYDYDETQDGVDARLSGGWGNNHLSHLDYGVTEYIEHRGSTMLQQVENADMPLVINHPRFNHPLQGDSLKLKIRTDGLTPDSVLVYLSVDGGNYEATVMDYDSVQRLIMTNEREYETELIASSLATESLEWYFEASSNGQTVREPCEGNFTWMLQESAAPLVINEIAPKNSFLAVDEFGEHDDWIEIHNMGAQTIQLAGFYLSDDPSTPDKWPFPDTSIAPGGFLMVWADKDGSQGPMHANFKLSGAGEHLVMYEQDGDDWLLVDQLVYEALAEETTLGYYPDGEGDVIELIDQTPGYSNLNLSIGESRANHDWSMNLYPNPAQRTVSVSSDVELTGIQVLNLAGQVLKTVAPTLPQMTFDVTSWETGVYLIRASTIDGETLTSRLSVFK